MKEVIATEICKVTESSKCCDEGEMKYFTQNLIQGVSEKEVRNGI